MWSDETSEWLRRIVMILFSLAGLAEQSAATSFQRRRYVLGILRRGEKAALGLLVDMSPRPQADFADYILQGVDCDTPEDAMQLACRFRMLALAIAHLASLGDGGFDHPNHGQAPRAMRRGITIPTPGFVCLVRRPAYIDSS